MQYMKNIETEWIVITGAPSSGKTSVIDTLELEGHTIMREAASVCIETRLKAGELLEEICHETTQIRLQDEILQKNMEQKELLDPAQRVYFDRCAVDTISYCKLYRLDEERFREAASRYRFKKVFLMERLPFEMNSVRIENDTTAQMLDQYLRESYTSLGYNVIGVPVMSIRERVDFILSTSGF